MANEVVVGNNIDMLSSTNKGFSIMLVDTPIHMVKEHFTNGWGQEWFEGDYVLQGLWHERLRPHIKYYYLLEEFPPAYVYSHLVVNLQIYNATYSTCSRGFFVHIWTSREMLVELHEGISSWQLIDEEDG